MPEWSLRRREHMVRVGDAGVRFGQIQSFFTVRICFPGDQSRSVLRLAQVVWRVVSGDDRGDQCVVSREPLPFGEGYCSVIPIARLRGACAFVPIQGQDDDHVVQFPSF